MVLLFEPGQKTIREIVFPANGPGWTFWMITPCFPAHSSSLPLMYSGPLSTRMAPGLPRHSMFEEDQETVRGTAFPTNGLRLRMTRSAATGTPPSA